ncbi:MAG: PD-(D/E)XK nuclease family protein, partial [Casimicrobiaceae bacterium]
MNPILDALVGGAIAVTPNRRLARRLQAAFDAALAARGRRAWATPTILPYATWLETLWDRVLASGERAAESRALLSAAQATALWEQVIEDSGATLADTRGAAALASDAWSLVHAWGAGGESWRSWTSPGDEHDPSLFAAWADAYLARQRRLGTLDGAQLADAIAARAAAIADGSHELLLAGFSELTPQQARLFAALESAGAVWREADPLPARAVHATRTSASSPRDELAAALAWARAHSIAHPGTRVGIVVLDLAERRDAVVALAQDMLAPASILPGRTRSEASFEVSLGTPLTAVPLVAAALDLVTMTTVPLSLAAAAALLRSAYLADADALWQRHAALERRWLEHGVRTLSLSDVIAAIAPHAPEMAARWKSGRDALHVTRATTPREWADAWRAWLVAAGWPGTRSLDSAEFQARKAWENLLAQFVSLGAVRPRLNAGAAIAALRGTAGEILFQPEGGDASIQILGLLEGAGLDFDALWVAGLSADRWPAAPRPNPLLPVAWQRDRGVPRASAQRELVFARALTERFARAADEVTFSSAAEIDDHPLSPSALIAVYPPKPALRRPETWSDSIAPGTLERLDDDRAPPLPSGSRVSGGARAIQTQSDCPFQAVARHRLGAEAWPAAPPGLAASERGKLVHATFAAFWTAVPDQSVLRAPARGALDARVAAAIVSGLGSVPQARWRNVPDAVRAAEARRLERLLHAWLDIERARPPFAVAAIEAPRTLTLGGVVFRMRLDRVDALDGGGVAIIDYKTGVAERPRQWFDDRPRASQLGMYALAQRAEQLD